jgi:hypothetical protein
MALAVPENEEKNQMIGQISKYTMGGIRVIQTISVTKWFLVPFRLINSQPGRREKP